MRWILIALLVVHGLIHVMGFLKAFGLAELPQLTQSISRPLGVMWLIAALLMVAAGATVVAAPAWFWLVGGAALLVSQVVIGSSWSDARIGTLANVVVLVAAIGFFASHGPLSLRRAYLTEVQAGLATARPNLPLVRDSDLDSLPDPVQRYLRLSRAVGQPQPSNFQATWTGRIRSSSTDPWMPFTAEQYSFFDAVPSRLFFMSAAMKHLPVDVLHLFVGVPATFRVRVLSAIPMVDASGPEMNRGETVTLFNDLCVLAPSRLIDPSIRWERIDAYSARAHYTRGDQTIGATLKFNDAGELIDFVSDDRTMASSNGRSFTPARWNTSLSKYRAFGSRRVPSIGEARWTTPSGAYTYGEFELTDLKFDVAPD